MRVELWSDPVCPYCWIGITHFRRALELLGGEAPPVELRWRGFMLDPGADAAPVPLAEAYARKFGGAEQAKALLAGSDGEQDVREDMDQARRLGISAVPFFLLEGRLAVRGAQPPEVFAGAIRQALSGPPGPHLPQ